MATLSRATAISDYASAVTAFRTAFATLAAADQALGFQGFGVPPDVVDLRHSVANGNESGSLQDDIRAARAANTFTV